MGVAVQVVGAQAGEPVDEVKLGEDRAFGAVHARLRGVQALTGEGGDACVQRGEGAGVALRTGGGVHGEGHGRGAEEEAGLEAGGEGGAGGGGQPGVDGLPGGEAGGGAFGMQQRDSGRAR